MGMGPTGLLAGLGGSGRVHCVNRDRALGGSGAGISGCLPCLCVRLVRRVDLHLLEKG